MANYKEKARDSIQQPPLHSDIATVEKALSPAAEEEQRHGEVDKPRRINPW